MANVLGLKNAVILHFEELPSRKIQSNQSNFHADSLLTLQHRTFLNFFGFFLYFLGIFKQRRGFLKYFCASGLNFFIHFTLLTRWVRFLEREKLFHAFSLPDALDSGNCGTIVKNWRLSTNFQDATSAVVLKRSWIQRKNRMEPSVGCFLL